MDKLDIAIGMSRKQKTWKNSRVTWQELAAKLATTVRTAETVAEYKALPRSRQAEIKDVGGFVGGYLAGGSRHDVKNRCVVCLDADYVTERDGLAEGFEQRAARALDGCAFTIYSTHKHEPKAPRLRLVFPLDRKVSPDEYQAVARKVAERVGLEMFDDTTYQANRLMYWPSTSSDGDFFHAERKGGAVSADSVLAEYDDWRDVSAWPASSRCARQIERKAEKQQDPRTKSGLVGAFCRTYTISEAIEAFVPDYEPVEGAQGRYTYTGGSTAGGVVTYDDLYSYSHHDTDPASMQLCNAFDLVRLHRFGGLDAEAEEGTPTGKLPSMAAMLDFAGSDEGTAETLNREAREAVADDFEIEAAEAAEVGEAEAEKALAKLTRDKQGHVVANYRNLEIIFANDPKLAGALRLNEFDRFVHVVRSPFLGRHIPEWDSTLRDIDDVNIRAYLDMVYGLRGVAIIKDAATRAASRNAYHPIKEYLEGLAWDGVPRLENMLVHWLGCEDSDYTRELTKRTMVAAVARVYEPGCKFDNMLVVKGDQGIGKSTIWQRLAGHWFSDSLKKFEGKEAYEAIQGVWLVEVPELAAMKKAEAEEIKSFMSKTTDRFRKAYGVNVEAYPRQCVFVGTTNESEFLRDTTGNRRFWIVESPKGGRGAENPYYMSQKQVDELWAEAKAIYDTEGLQDLTAGTRAIAEAKGRDYSEDDPRTAAIYDYLEKPIPIDYYERAKEARRDYVNGYSSYGGPLMPRDCVSVPEVMYELFGKEVGTYDRYESVQIGKIVGAAPGWQDRSSVKRVPGYGPVKVRYRDGVELFG